MQSKNKILAEIYTSKELHNCLLLVKNESIREDIKQEIFLTLLQKEEDFIIALSNNNKLKAYISSCIFNEAYSPRSNLRKKFGKESVLFIDAAPIEKILIDEIIEANKKHDKAIEIFLSIPQNNIYKQIFLSLCKYGSYRKLSLAMNIPHTTLRDMVENFKNEIKNKL